MACTSAALAGLTADCKGSQGGIKAAFITSSRPTFTEASGKLTITTASNANWYRYYFKKNTSNFTSTLTVDEANGLSYVTTAINLVFSRMDTAKRVEMSALSMNDMYIIIVDSNNQVWYFGHDEPVRATAGTGETGTAKGDGNKYTITLTDESETWPFTVTKLDNTAVDAEGADPVALIEGIIADDDEG